MIILSFESVNFDNLIDNWTMESDKIHYHVMVFVVEGNVQYRINDEEVLLKKGEIMYIPSMAVRSACNYQNEPHQKYTVLFYLSENVGIPYLRENRYFKMKPLNFEYFKQRAAFLYTDVKGQNKYNDFICRSVLQEVIGMLARSREECNIPSLKRTYAQKMQDYIINNYRSHIEIDCLAKLIQKSPNYTISLFKDVTGKTPIQYLHQLRISEACNLLVHSSMDIINISDYLGYYDLSYFCRTFKKIMSISPSEYQKAGYKVK